MRLSTKGEYGMLALVDLAVHDQGEPVQVAQIARRQDIPKAYLDQLLVILKRAGLVASSRGRQGGYRLARPANRITLLEAVHVLEGPVTNQNFVSHLARRRKSACHAVLKTVWDELTDRSADLLRSKTLLDISAECRKSEETPMYYI
jgi:Rrf2 family transcriptional regulator, cysteine metabolism repressor